MLDKDNLPKISTPISTNQTSLDTELYIKGVKRCLKKFLPKDFFSSIFNQEDTPEGRELYLNKQLPLFTLSALETPPFNLSFFLFCPYRANAFQFFFDMLSRWMIPGYRLNVLLIYAADINLPEFGPNLYTSCEVVVQVENEMELDEIIRNFPVIESQIKLGVASSYYARRILEIKGLAADEKIAHIHEQIAFIIDRLPQTFDFDLLTEMQHLLIVCQDTFKAYRSPRHLTRLISVFYLFRKQIQTKRRLSPNKRHVVIKPYRIRFPHEQFSRHVLGMIVAMNFLREKEHFDEPHLLKAIKKLIPTVRAIKNSFLSISRGDENICTLYLEVEKESGEAFLNEEITLLKSELPRELKARIEHAMHPLFNPRNEEEIMRNILVLSKQIKYVRDLPQVCITFDEQTFGHLYFTIILVRILKDSSDTIQELFAVDGENIEYFHDRCKRVGYLRKKYPIEATVFRLKIKKDNFLREDHSIDLYKARQKVVKEIQRVMGPMRDYNGGMIAKQNELLDQLREILQQSGEVNHLLLENFFHSMHPPVMRSVMEHTALARLYKMIQTSASDGIPEGQGFSLTFYEEAEFLFTVFATDEAFPMEKLDQSIFRLNIAPSSLAKANIVLNEISCTGYIYRVDNPERREAFKESLRSVLDHHFFEPVIAT